MFVLLAIPIVGGFIAGRILASQRAVMILAGVLWLVASGLMIAERAGWILDEQSYTGPKNEFNVTFWIGVAVGLIGFASARLGNRMRHGRAPR